MGDLKPSTRGSRLLLLSARPAVTFPAEERHRPSVVTKLYCFVTEAHACEQLAQGCYLEADRPRFEPATFRIASERSTVKPHRTHNTKVGRVFKVLICHTINLSKLELGKQRQTSVKFCRNAVTVWYFHSGWKIVGQTWCFLCWWPWRHYSQIQKLGCPSTSSWTFLWYVVPHTSLLMWFLVVSVIIRRNDNFVL